MTNFMNMILQLVFGVPQSYPRLPAQRNEPHAQSWQMPDARPAPHKPPLPPRLTGPFSGKIRYKRK